jgi:hypothetical protein
LDYETEVHRVCSLMAGQPIARQREGRPPAPGGDRPPRGYTWETFTEGNQLGLRHGAFSERKVEPIATALVAGLLSSRPDLAAYPETVHAWARAEARCLLLADWVAEHGLVDADGNTPASLRYVAQFERLALDLRSQLGLDPRSEAELARSRVSATAAAFDLDAVRASGREVLAARALVLEPGATDDDPEP